ncbi:hypothetical protein [Pedobacter nyackensis]|uniref:Uncharacterized protein n=1 Tax=Pedobacter nyackensis TaxID=475255 RepID=A0A1W2DFK4_9SPHI|nr:hypothetical protein [Pedobacter nyackensis]SMC95718.1 hypothetical protein SAMN04488101_106250 [Pedobacter nyackensis]
MKNSRLNIALLSLIFAFTSCKKISESIQQDIIVNDTTSFEIPVLSNINSPATIAGIPSHLNLEEQLRNTPNNFTIEHITAVKMKSLALLLDSIKIDLKNIIDTNNNFGNLETIRFRIATGGNVSNIANASVTSSSISGSLSLTPDILPDTLKSFIIQPSRTYNIVVKAKTATATPMKVKARAVYTITLSK